MQFTPQQLTGGPRFQHRTRIGNWNEDLELEEIKMKDFLKKKEMGSLLVNTKQQMLEECLQRVDLDTSDDGALHFGQRIMLVNHQSESWLCANPHDKVPKEFDACVLTTGPNNTSCVRNVFVLERADDDDGFPGDMVHYGQDFRLRLEPFSDMAGPMYMHSELVTALASSKFSRCQEVVVGGTRGGSTLWQVLFPDSQQRFEMEGTPVPAGCNCVLRHVQTGSFLASDKIPYQNIFGQEFEVHCHPYYSINKTQNLTSEKKGEITGDYALRRHGLANVWNIVLGNDGSSG